MNITFRNVLSSAVALGILGTSIAASQTALAQSNPMVLANTRGGTGAVLGEPGTYEVRTYNQAELERMLVQHFGSRQNEDAQFVSKTVKDIESQITSLNDDLIREGGILSVQRNLGASGTSPVDLALYLGMTQEFRAKVLKVETSIRGMLLIPGALKSQESVTIDTVERIRLPGPLKIDLEKIQTWYQDQMAQVVTPLAQLRFLLMMPDGSPKLVQGLGFQPQGLQIPAAQIEAMQKRVEQEMMLVSGELTQKIQDINLVTMEQLRSSIRAFGSTQTYRFQLNKEGRDRNLQALAEIFWARDYLRALYGNAAKLGAIGVDYSKQKAHWDFFASSNKMMLIDQPIVAPGRLTEMQDSIATVLKTQESRNKQVFGEGVDMLSRIMSGVTFIKGESQLASINTAILTLMKRDIEHEIELQYAGATARMQKIYQNTYYGAEGSAQEKRTMGLEDSYADATSGTATDINSDLLVTAGGTTCDFLCSFRRSEMSLKILVDKSQQARNALKGIEELRKLSGAQQIIDGRREGLRRRQ